MAIKRKAKAPSASFEHQSTQLNNNWNSANPDISLPKKEPPQLANGPGIAIPSFSSWTYHGIIAAVCIICYWNGLHGDFVHDDVLALKDNKDIRPTTPLSDVFLNDFWGKRMSDNTSHKSYRPLSVLTFRLNYYFGELDPVGYHGVNIALHSMVSVLFLHVCHRCVFLDLKPAVIAALMFATHPVHTEAVTGIVGRADVMACFLFLLSFLTFLRSVDERDPKKDYLSTKSPFYLMLSVFLGACNMLIKEHGITVLGVCIVYDVLVLNRNGTYRFLQTRRLDKTCLPLVKRISVILITLIVLLAFRIWMLSGHLPAFSDQDNPASFAPNLGTRFGTYCFLLIFNAWLLLAPIVLCYDWQMGSIPLVESITDPRNLATIAFVVVMATVSVYCLLCVFKEKKYDLRVISTGLMFLVIPFLPASNLFIRVGFVVAERILYIPSLGFCILISHGINNMCKSTTKKAVSVFVTILALLLVVFFAWRTVIRNPVWNTRESLFKSGVHTLPHNAKAHYNYANYLKDIGLSDEAAEHYRKTLELYPRHASATNNLGTLMKESSTESEVLFRRAIEINPSHVRAYFNLANHLNNFPGRQDEAISLLVEAINIDDKYADAYTSLAGIMLDSGQFTDAETLYQKVITLTPNDPNAYNNYGALFVRTEQQEKAVEQYLKCLDLDPKHTVALVNIARLYRKMGKTQKAEDMYSRSLAVQRDAETLKSLAALYFNTNRFRQAKKTFEEALVLEPDSPEINTNYAQVLARLDKLHEAIAILEDVIARNAGYGLAHRHLASVLSLNRDYIQAIKHIDKYLELDADLDANTKSEILYEQGSNYREINKDQEAIKCYLEAVKLNPRFAMAQMNLGAMYHIQDDIIHARRHYKAALELDPNNAIIRENMKKLENREAKLKNMKKKMQ